MINTQSDLIKNAIDVNAVIPGPPLLTKISHSSTGIRPWKQPYKTS